MLMQKQMESITGWNTTKRGEILPWKKDTLAGNFLILHDWNMGMLSRASPENSVQRVCLAGNIYA